MAEQQRAQACVEVFDEDDLWALKLDEKVINEILDAKRKQRAWINEITDSRTSVSRIVAGTATATCEFNVSIAELANFSLHRSELAKEGNVCVVKPFKTAWRRHAIIDLMVAPVTNEVYECSSDIPVKIGSVLTEKRFSRLAEMHPTAVAYSSHKLTLEKNPDTLECGVHAQLGDATKPTLIRMFPPMSREERADLDRLGFLDADALAGDAVNVPINDKLTLVIVPEEHGVVQFFKENALNYTKSVRHFASKSATTEVKKGGNYYAFTQECFVKICQDIIAASLRLTPPDAPGIGSERLYIAVDSADVEKAKLTKDQLEAKRKIVFSIRAHMASSTIAVPYTAEEHLLGVLFGGITVLDAAVATKKKNTNDIAFRTIPPAHLHDYFTEELEKERKALKKSDAYSSYIRTFITSQFTSVPPQQQQQQAKSSHASK